MKKDSDLFLAGISHFVAFIVLFLRLLDPAICEKFHDVLLTAIREWATNDDI